MKRNNFIILFAVLAMLGLVISATAQEPTYFGVFACQVCHAGGPGGDQFQDWQNTRHATAFDSASAFVQSTAECLQCHTTGWDTLTANMGADDFVTITGGTVTVENQAEFDKHTNVQCESCHGPASEHIPGSFNDPPVLPPKNAGEATTCGECHQDEHHPFIEEWMESKHAISDTNASAALAERFVSTDCSGCHTMQGFIQFVGTTREDTVNVEPHDINAPGREAALPIVCATCHDPHSKKNPRQLRLPVADLCAKCHNPEEAQPPDSPHHTTASMFAGMGAYEFDGVNYDVARQSAHQLLSPTADRKCAACHVYMTPLDEGDPDDPNDDKPAATGHTFEPRMEACMQAGCHTSGLSDTGGREFNHRGRQALTENLLAKLETKLTQIETKVLPTATAADSFKYQLGRFNFEFVTNEGSRGVHNSAYSELVLRSTIAFLDTALVTSVRTLDFGDGGPKTFALHQNFPNPFNPVTSIRFDITTAGPVQLAVFNAIGQQVETLVDKVLTPDSYEVVFNAEALSSGIYFYKIIAENHVLTRKMLLLK